MKLSFRPLRREDFPLLSQWLSRPHVERWWREAYDIEAIERNYGPAVDGTDPTHMLIVDQDGEPVGFAQLYRMDDNPDDWVMALAPAGAFNGAAGIDYLIGEEAAVGHGLGPRIIDCLVDRARQCYPDVARVVVSVAQDNRRSWRALEKAGFERVWAGDVVSDDPSDSGPSYVYVRSMSGAYAGGCSAPAEGQAG